MSLSVAAAYVAVILVWGGTWGAIKIGVAQVPPFLFAFERAIAVAALLTIVSLIFGLRFPRGRRVLAAAAVAGIFNTGSSWAIIFWAEQFVPSGLVAVFGATAPVWTAFLAHFLVRGDRLSALKLTALAVGLAGTAVLVGAPDAGAGPMVPVATALLALMPITWAFAAILAARHLAAESPLPVIAVETWSGGVFLLPFALTQLGEPAVWTLETTLSFAYLVLLGSGVGLTLNLWLYRRLRPTTIMLATILIPAEALLIGAVALGEELTARMLVGAALIVAAVALNTRAGGDSSAREPASDRAVATPAD
ncbi:MAG: DMT family transporter [Candidatus Limnocylindria bacterium]